MMRRLVLANLLVLLMACYDRETPRIQTHWLRALDGYELVPLHVSRRALAGEDAMRFQSVSGAFSLDDAGLRLSLSQGDYPTSFWLELTNRSSQTVDVSWIDSRYVDELQQAHGIYAQPMNPLPSPEEMKKGATRSELKPGEGANYVLAPTYKAIVVRYDAYERGPFHAPLIPTNLTDLDRFPDESSVKQYVADVVNRQLPVKVVLSIESGAQKYEYTFSFALREHS